ncbi:MAG: Y-family DNA polymerase [Candidatus Pacebacteria bacterium]|nr:Y-family DNA polymerase [Candidatus Paceibacterota bacterium]
MKQQLIGLLDCNNFFVSCERLFRPDLIGKPVLVLSSNDGCVVARSQEVKDIGVLMGVPYFQIKDIVKKHGITVFSSHFALYRDISRRVFSVMRQELEIVEQYSIDEAFFAVKGDSYELAKRVKSAVERSVGIPVSVGIAATKTQVKYANSLAKRGGGVHVLDDDTWKSSVSDIPLSSIWGVGGKLSAKYRQHQLHTVADLLRLDRQRVATLFGVGGVRLQAELSGESVFPLLQKHEPQQSIMSSRSFRESTTQLPILEDAVAYHVRHAAADLRSQGQETTRLLVSIRPSRHGDFMFRGGSKEAVLLAPTNDSMALLKVAHDLLRELFEPDVPYKKAGVMLTGLCLTGGGQQSLFTPKKEASNEQLMSVIDGVNRREGREVIQIGSRLQSSHWQAKAEVCSPSYTTQWSEVAVVKAK